MSDLVYNLDISTSKATQAINFFFKDLERNATGASAILNNAFNQDFETSVKIQFEDGKVVAKEVANIQQESQKIQTVWKAVNGEVGKTPAELKKQISILKALRDDVEKYQKGTAALNEDWVVLTKKIEESEAALRKMTGAFNQADAAGKSAGQNIIGRFTLAQVAAGYVTKAINGIANGIKAVAQSGGQLQVLELTLEAFTGSAEAATNALSTFREIAATTSFNLEQVAGAGQILLAYGVATGQAVESTRQLSIIASATGGDIQLLARNLGQVVSQGRAYTRDLTQFAIQGIPIWTELEKVTGENVATLKEFAKDGKIGFLEVQAALDNMTQEGGAFAEIADRIDQTWIGKLRKLESSVQNFSLELIKGTQYADELFGNPATAMLEAFNVALNGVAENMTSLVNAIASAAIAAGVFFAALAVSKITATVIALGGIVSTLQLIASTLTTALLPSLAALAANPVLLAAIAVGATAAALAYTALSEASDRAAAEQVLVANGLTEVLGTINQLSAIEGNVLSRFYDGVGSQAKYYNDLLTEQAKRIGEAGAALGKQREILQGLISIVERRYDIEIDKQKRVIEGIDELIAAEEKRTQKAIQAINKQYSEERKQINDTYNERLKVIDAEIAAEQKRGPAAERLYQFEKQALTQKIASGKLSEEELLRAQAQLERMQQQEKVQKLQEERAKIRAEQEAKLLESQEKQKNAIEDLVKALESFIGQQEQAKKQAEDAIAQQEEEKKAAVEKYDAMLEKIDTQIAETLEANDALGQQVAIVEDLVTQYQLATDEANKLAAAAQKALNLQAQAGGGGEGRFAGGPVSGGKTYTVNELGQEAFLSAAGRLSMINAPAFGQWRAPGAGTVIPAHLTQQLSIPSGGVRVNSAPTNNAGRSGGGMNAIARALGGLQASGNVQNNVTIQSSNPVQAANQMMVQLTKIKRARYTR